MPSSEDTYHNTSPEILKNLKLSDFFIFMAPATAGVAYSLWEVQQGDSEQQAETASLHQLLAVQQQREEFYDSLYQSVNNPEETDLQVYELAEDKTPTPGLSLDREIAIREFNELFMFYRGEKHIIEMVDAVRSGADSYTVNTPLIEGGKQAKQEVAETIVLIDNAQSSSTVETEASIPAIVGIAIGASFAFASIKRRTAQRNKLFQQFSQELDDPDVVNKLRDQHQ